MNVSTVSSTRNLRNLYFIRTVFQVLWATAVIIAAPSQPQLAASLFILYPLWDVACTLYDLKTSSQSGNTRTSQSVNAILGITTALGIGLTVFQHPTYAIACFGAWAFGAGALQLVAAIIRRKQELSGQWSMILSGSQSALAGVFYIVGGLADKKHIRDVGGYAIFGALYFFISAIFLTRRLTKLPITEVI